MGAGPAWLLAAALLHLVLAGVISFIGYRGLVPALFDSHGTATFAMDSQSYSTQVLSLAKTLRLEGLAAWLSSPAALHVRFYSLSFATLIRAGGFWILAAEPLNLAYYVTILFLIFKLGEATFDRRAGLTAAVVVALWPSFLLHSTQLLRDPLFIVTILALALVLTFTLTIAFSWRGALAAGLGGALVLSVLWLVRRETWPVVYGFVIPGALLLAVRQIRERRVIKWNLLVAVLLLGVTVLIPRLVPPMIEPGAAQAPVQSPGVLQPCGIATEATPRDNWLGGLLAEADSDATRIGDLRARFVALYPEAGSNVDTDVRICTFMDLLGYVPRAAAIGFLAPFPSQWLETGAQVGLVGRLASGVETLCMYGIEVLALVAALRGRRSLPMWFLLTAATAGMIALGLVVVNVGALYPMRYVYWMLILVLGSGGAWGVVRPTIGKRSQGDPGIIPSS